jgi:hypothetical protein
MMWFLVKYRDNLIVKLQGQRPLGMLKRGGGFNNNMD